MLPGLRAGCLCREAKDFSKVGAVVQTPEGEGKVREIMIMRGIVKVTLDSGDLVDFP